MDEITPNATNTRNTSQQSVGCSTVLINQPDCVRISQSNHDTLKWFLLFRQCLFCSYTLQEVIAHTEDALIEVLNHYYIVSAHIIEPAPQGKYKVCLISMWPRVCRDLNWFPFSNCDQVTEERFTSVCYAGHLPGYNPSYNHHGVVFTMNTLSAAKLHSGKTRKHFR